MKPKHFHIIACHVLWREICFFSARMPHTFNFTFLQQGLHDTPEELRKELQQAVDNVNNQCDYILVGYGLCSNGIVGIRAGNFPLVVMRGHDCITFFLGSMQRYRQLFDANPGIYWYTPGWIETGKTPMPGKERFDKLYQEFRDKFGEENADYLMEVEKQWIRDYHTAAYSDLGVGEREKYITYTKQCADYLNWEFQHVNGNPQLLKDFLRGNWDDERFLIVPPGHRIVASHNDKIIDVRLNE
ncbi:DUF1638 domain-containing protein [candidate division KSB1 bacterium]|nr:DUF1638 domain-containing protein [candidate division KSB1 bacterium]